MEQKSWFKLDPNFPFQPTFKYWFALMWENWYIQLFLACIIWIITIFLQLFGQYSLAWLAFPIGIMIMISIGGFWFKYQSQKTDK